MNQKQLHEHNHDDHSHHDHGHHGDHDSHANENGMMHHAEPDSHDAHANHSSHGDHSEHGGHMGHADVFKRLFWVNLILSIPVVVTSHMIMDWFGYSLPDFPGDSWIGPVLGTVIFFYGGRVFLTGAIDEVKSRQPGMMTLISLAISVAFLASWATTLGWLDMDFWWELALLVTIMLLGHWLEMRALGASQNALQALADLIPDEAERIVGDRIETVAPSDLSAGDIVLVRPGASVPADGEIVDGESDFDESMITGESQPVSRGVGENVIAGAVVSSSSVRFKVTANGDETVLAGIQRLVADAQASKTSTQKLADTFAGWLFYIATISAIATFLIWWLWIGDLNEAITRAVTLLVISCPHALGLAIPLVVAITTEVGARNGVLIRDRVQLERFRQVNTVLWDKTGTLTKGEHVLQDVIATDGSSEQFLAIAAAVEQDSEHPLARAIVAGAAELNLTLPHVRGFEARAGRGVSAHINGTEWVIGGPRVLRESGVALPEKIQRWQGEWAEHGAAILYAITGSEVRGALALADEVRPESAAAIQEFAADNVSNVMMTGDAKVIAESVANEIGVETVIAEVLPEDKQLIVRETQSVGNVVAMVGDGVNDAPALALADVGLAIGAGTDVAIQSAGIILASSDPRTVPGTRRLSAAMYRKMIQNLAWAAGYNLIAIPLAAGVLAPWGINMPPAIAAVLMSASTIVVALNAQTLRRFQLLPTRSSTHQ